jgi:hypothetical protein
MTRKMANGNNCERQRLNVRYCFFATKELALALFKNRTDFEYIARKYFLAFRLPL